MSKLNIKPVLLKHQNLEARGLLQIRKTTSLIILQFHGAAKASKQVLMQTIFDTSSYETYLEL